MEPSADWHWEDVKAAIRKRGITLADLSQQVGLGRSSVRHIKFQSFPRAQEAVAALLGVPAHHIWPSRYDEHGNPLRLRQRRPNTPKSIPGCDTETPQKRKAA